MNGQNKYTVAQRLNILESRCTALEAENKELRTHLAGQLETKINDAKNLIQDSIRVPADGAPGRDGTNGVDGQSIVGPQGPRGDACVIGSAEMAAAVIELRRKLKEHHAAVIARLIEGIEANRRPGSSGAARILATHLEMIKRDIENLK
jgi:hypothetical protein